MTNEKLVQYVKEKVKGRDAIFYILTPTTTSGYNLDGFAKFSEPAQITCLAVELHERCGIPLREFIEVLIDYEAREHAKKN